MPACTLLYFAQVQELLGLAQETWTLPSPTSDAAILDAIAARHPAAAALLPGCRLAVQCAFTAGPVHLVGGEEIAVIPPVSGG